jgi:hypothetical protein
MVRAREALGASLGSSRGATRKILFRLIDRSDVIIDTIRREKGFVGNGFDAEGLRC